MHRVDRPCASCGEVKPRLRMDVAWARGAAAAALALTVAGAVWQWAPSAGARGLMVAEPAPDAGAPRGAEAAKNGELTNRPIERLGSVGDPAIASTAAPASGTAVGVTPSPAAGSPVAGARVDSMTWVPAVARTWVNVRSDASRGGEVVGVIKPSSRAMLGSNRAGWRQVRSPDAVGWVDPRLFEADSTRPRGE